MRDIKEITASLNKDVEDLLKLQDSQVQKAADMLMSVENPDTKKTLMDALIKAKKGQINVKDFANILKGIK